MDRAIKFRAWDVRKKKMIYPSTFKRWGFINHEREPDASACFGGGEILLSTDPRFYEWMQFTGLHDKNGTPIYEWDLLATSNDGKDGADVWAEEPMGIVCWDEKFAHWQHNIDIGTNDSIYSQQYVYIHGNLFEPPKPKTTDIVYGGIIPPMPKDSMIPAEYNQHFKGKAFDTFVGLENLLEELADEEVVKNG